MSDLAADRIPETPQQLDAIGSWRRRERATRVQIFADGSWRTTGTITPAQEADCMERLKQVTRLLPGLRLRIAGGGG